MKVVVDDYCTPHKANRGLNFQLSSAHSHQSCPVETEILQQNPLIRMEAVLDLAINTEPALNPRAGALPLALSETYLFSIGCY